MKKANQYLEDIKEKYNIGTAWQVTKPYLLEAIKIAQIDAIEETCRRCAKKATTKSYKLSIHSKTPRWKKIKEGEEVDLFSHAFKTEISKSSILKVADEMKEELECLKF